MLARGDGIMGWHLAATLEQSSDLGVVREVHRVTQAFLIADAE